MCLTVLAEALDANANDGGKEGECQHKGASDLEDRESKIMTGFFLPVLRRSHTSKEVVACTGLRIIDGNVEGSKTLDFVLVFKSNIQEATPEAHGEGERENNEGCDKNVPSDVLEERKERISTQITKQFLYRS